MSFSAAGTLVTGSSLKIQKFEIIFSSKRVTLHAFLYKHIEPDFWERNEADAKLKHKTISHKFAYQLIFSFEFESAKLCAIVKHWLKQ